NRLEANAVPRSTVEAPNPNINMRQRPRKGPCPRQGCYVHNNQSQLKGRLTRKPLPRRDFVPWNHRLLVHLTSSRFFSGYSLHSIVDSEVPFCFLALNLPRWGPW